jgi:Chaperone of endosialidase
MRPFYATVVVILVFLSAVAVRAQSVPRLINVTSAFQPADGQPPPSQIGVTFSIYADQEGGTPLWQESQTVTLDKAGRFTVLLGSTQTDGVSPDVFASREGLWLGMQFAATGEVERPRVRLASVPYALRAADADTLGGRPASAYLLAPTSGETASSNVTSTTPGSSADLIAVGTPGLLAKYTNTTDVGNSAVFESSGLVGIGTLVPLDVLHVQFTNTNGGMTGFAVQNMGSSATSYSGMLFYDQTGALGQFQGFNNSTHEYRINNIGKNVSSQFNGSINFMIGSTSRFFVASNGNVGINTTGPAGQLDVSNALSTVSATNLNVTTFGANPFGSVFAGRKARGTSAAPSGVLTGDALGIFGGRGYGSTGFSSLVAGMTVRASENWTDAAHGTYMDFSTIPNGTTGLITSMTLDSFGRLGIGTFPNSVLDIARQGDSEVRSTSFSGESAFVARNARGTAQAPSQVLTEDFLGAFAMTGYGTTGFGNGTAGVAGIAAENFTDTAQGTALVFLSTPIGTNEALAHAVVMPDGNTAIGTFNAFPTVPDKFVVFGDIRVGTTGTDGCLKNFAGTGLTGVCSSDRRLKKDITPFGPVLNQVAALQPVHYYWRAAEFPDRHFGTSRTYGLVAQDVEEVLPELVVTNGDGFKAVDYSKLPLLTIQAIKELKAENDALKQRVTETEALKQRVAELERLVTELLATGRR